MTQKFSTSKMLFSHTTKTLSMEASDARFRPAGKIEVQSHRTGRVIAFVKVSTVRELDGGEPGDVLHWVYRPLEEVGIDRLLVFND